MDILNQKMSDISEDQFQEFIDYLKELKSSGTEPQLREFIESWGQTGISNLNRAELEKEIDVMIFFLTREYKKFRGELTLEDLLPEGIIYTLESAKEEQKWSSHELVGILLELSEGRLPDSLASIREYEETGGIMVKIFDSKGRLQSKTLGDYTNGLSEEYLLLLCKLLEEFLQEDQEV